MCHNSEDKPAVREIARMLVKEGIKPWLDEEQIRPGTSWQTALGEQIESIKSAAVFVGENGHWSLAGQEIQAFLSRIREAEMSRHSDGLGCRPKQRQSCLGRCANLHWVDFRVTEPDLLRQTHLGNYRSKSRAARGYRYFRQRPAQCTRQGSTDFQR